MTPTTQATTTEQLYRVYVKAPPEKVWEAITRPEWTERYLYESRVDYDLRRGGAYRAYPSDAMRTHGAELGYPIPDVVADGEVVEADPPRKLVQTWRMLMDQGMAAEGFTRLTWELEELEGGVTRLTVTHQLQGAPQTAAVVAGEMEDQGAGGGWNEVLSGLKTLLETGKPLRG